MSVRTDKIKRRQEGNTKINFRINENPRSFPLRTNKAQENILQERSIHYRYLGYAMNN